MLLSAQWMAVVNRGKYFAKTQSHLRLLTLCKINTLDTIQQFIAVHLLTNTVVSVGVEVEALVAVALVHEVVKVEAALLAWRPLLTPACSTGQLAKILKFIS